MEQYKEFFDELRNRYFYQRVSDGTFIPQNDLNSDYKQMQADIQQYGENQVLTKAHTK